jgi:hypothetical protein
MVELLNVPGKCGRHDEVVQALKQKIHDSESLLLPMATIFETGNHVAQNGDGSQRRRCAIRFVEQVQRALDGQSPFVPLRFPNKTDVRAWLNEFPEHAMRSSGLGDLSIIHDYKFVREASPGRDVYIWSFDAHLAAYRTV